MTASLDAFAAYLPRHIVERLAADPAPPEQPREEWIDAAALFADVVGFTEITRRFTRRGRDGADQLSAVLNAFFGELIRVIESHGGDVVKFAGDALLAIWPVDPSEGAGISTRRAVRCGLAAQEAVRDFVADGEELRLRISVHEGPVRLLELGGPVQMTEMIQVAGGTDAADQRTRWESLAVGDALTKVCGLRATPGMVAVSKRAWGLTGGAFTGEPHGESGYVITGQAADAPHDPPPRPRPPLTPTMRAGMEAFIPGAVRMRLAAGQTEHWAEMRHVTILFLRLHSFIAELDLGAAQDVMQALQTAVYHYEGSVNKLSFDDKGVSLLAAFGLPPLAHDDDPERALRAAEDIRAALRELKQPVSGVGVATGRVFCGPVGGDHRREYTVIGAPVNMAARLMQVARGRILCDAATRQACRRVFDFLGPLEEGLEDRDFRADAYEPTGVRKSATASQQLIGRDQELAVIEDAFRALSEHSEGGVLLMEGEAGGGKSRLLSELTDRAVRRGLRPLCGGGDAFETSTPYFAWRPVVAELLRGADGQDAALKKFFEAFPQQREMAPLLNVVLPRALPASETTGQMDRLARAENTRRLLTRLIAFAASQTSVVVVLDDAHWMDSASWAVARRLTRKAGPALLVLAHRPFDGPPPEDYTAFRDRPATRHIRLASLPEPQCERLVCETLGVASVPAAVTRWIVRRSEGHPFYCEELTHLLRESGRLRIEDGYCELVCPASELDGVGFPDALDSVINERLDKLDVGQQLTVTTASAIGRTFEHVVLRHAFPQPDARDRLPTYLDELHRRDIAVPAPRPESTSAAHAFKHGLIQEVAYRKMLRSARSALHRAIADWYESQVETNPAGVYPLLAHHWQQARDNADVLRRDERAEANHHALRYQELAGDWAFQNAAYREAVAFFTAALESLSQLDERERAEPARRLQEAAILRRLGAAHLGLDRFRDSYACCLRALELLGERGAVRVFERELSPHDGPARPVDADQSHLNESSVPAFSVPASQQQLGERDVPLLREALAIGYEVARVLSRWLIRWRRFQRVQRVRSADAHGPLLEAARVYDLLFEIGIFANDSSAVFYACLRGLNLAERAGESAELAHSRAATGLMAGMIPWHPLARAEFQQARQTADALENLALRAEVAMMEGIYHIGLGQWSAAETCLNAALATYQRLGDRRRICMILTFLGATLYYRGDFTAAERTWSEEHELARRRGDHLTEGWGLGGRALNVLRLGRSAEAAELAEEALAVFRAHSDRISEVTTGGVLAIARLRLGELDAAAAAAAVVWEQIRGLGRPTYYYLLDGYAAVAEVGFALHQRSVQGGPPHELAAATPAAVRALKTFGRIFPIGRPRALIWQARLAEITGRRSRARDRLARAIDAAKSLGMRYDLGLAYLESARLNGPGHRDSESLRNAAAAIFTEIGAADELQSLGVEAAAIHPAASISSPMR